MEKDNYCWESDTLDNFIENLKIGNPVSFQFHNQDYFIEGHRFDPEGLGRVGAYTIANPNVQPDGSFGHMIPYNEDNRFSTYEELISSPFLQGFTLIEAFDEIKFFS